MTFNPAGPNFGDFTASGTAVDAALVCANGTFVDTGLGFQGFQSGRRVQVFVTKTFTCDDASGTFSVKLQINASFDGTETFGWVIQGGTGAYANLQGAGNGSTVPVFSGDVEVGNINTYDGYLTN